MTFYAKLGDMVCVCVEVLLETISAENKMQEVKCKTSKVQ
jgi:hypothetical protein